MKEKDLNFDQVEALDLLFDWYKDKRIGFETATLEGYAGTGKTTLMEFFVKRVKVRKVCVSAPTNRAKNVIANKTGMMGKTVHSILGLMPNMDLATFNPRNPAFEPINPPNINYDLVIIDEASMINKDLYKEICELAKEKKVKVLFLGDRYQLPPIKEKVSKVFTDSKYRAVLNEVVRQGDGNPNSELIRVALSDVVDRTDRLASYIKVHYQDIEPEKLQESKGFIYITDNKLLKEFFVSDKTNFLNNNSKYLAFTNNSVLNSVATIRKNILGYDNFINVGESIVGYRTVSDKIGKEFVTKIVNSEEYKILDVVPNVLDNGIKGFNLYVENVFTNQRQYISVVDSTDEDNYNIYNSIVARLIHTAKNSVGKSGWAKYYHYTNNNLSMGGVLGLVGGIEETVKDKDIYYSYGITVHKSQGGTYRNSFVNFKNIQVCYNNADRRRLLYVALSRASHCNIIF